VVDEYTRWSGRIAQMTLLGVGFGAFGENIVRVMPILLFAGLVGVIGWLIRLVWRCEWKICCVLSVLLAGGAMLSMKSLFDTFLWLDASAIYMSSLIFVVFSVCTVIFLVCNRRVALWKKAGLLVVVMFGATASEPASVVMLMGMLVWMSYSWWKNDKTTVLMATLVVGAISVGLVMMYFSPGLQNRTDVVGGSVTLVGMLIRSPIASYKSLLSSMELFQVGLMVIIGVLVGTITYKKRSWKVWWRVIVLAGVVVFMATYGTFVIYSYGYKTEYAALARVMTLPNFAVFVAVVMMVGATIWMIRKDLVMKVAAAAVLLVGVIIVRSLISFGLDHVRAMALRESLVVARSLQVRSAKEGEKIIVYDAPVMLRHSEATDFTMDGWVVDWFHRAFLRRYGLKESQLVVIGRQSVWHTEEFSWFLDVSGDDQYLGFYCVRGRFIKEEFVCR